MSGAKKNKDITKDYVKTLPTQETAYCLFMDDVRQEISGKHIYIGVYGPDILMKKFPAVIPLSIVMYFRAPTEATFNNAKVTIILPDNNTIVADFDGFDFTDESVIKNGEKATYNVAQMVMKLASVEINKAGRISVIVNTGSRDIYAGSVEIKEYSRAPAP